MGRSLLGSLLVVLTLLTIGTAEAQRSWFGSRQSEHETRDVFPQNAPDTGNVEPSYAQQFSNAYAQNQPATTSAPLNYSVPSAQPQVGYPVQAGYLPANGVTQQFGPSTRTPMAGPNQPAVTYQSASYSPTRLPTAPSNDPWSGWGASTRPASVPIGAQPYGLDPPPMPTQQNYGVWMASAPATFQFAEANAATVAPPSIETQQNHPLVDATCQPTCGFWEGSVDLLALRRSYLHSYGLITPTAIGSPTLNVSNLPFDFALGMQASLARHTASGVTIEGRAMWIDDWSTSRQVAGNVALQGPGFQLAVAPGEFDVRYSSRLLGAELNIGDYLCDHCGCFIGLRWLHFEDNLTVDELDLPVAGALNIATQNDLLGVQVGRLMRVADVGGFRSRIFAKGGVYYNFVDTNIQSSFLGPPIHGNDYDVAFIGEFGIDVAWCITERLRVRAAYEIIGVSQVATSTDQIAVSDLSIGVAGINTNGLFFDGGYVGIEWVH